MMSRLTLRSLLMTLTLLIAATAAAQVRPSVLTSATPYGLQRGTTATFVVDGANLEGATEVLFSDAGLTATIDRYEDLGLLKRFDGTRAPDEVHNHIRATIATMRMEEQV